MPRHRGVRRRFAGLSRALIVAVVLSGATAVELVPRAADVLTVLDANSQKDVRLDANLVIPDGGELLLPIEVPREPVQMDSSGPAKVTRVYSDHVDGSFGVGEKISIFVEFTSAVQVVGDAPGLLLRTGCHDSRCRTKEVQRLRCLATEGKFAVAFAGQRVLNIPWDATQRQFAAYLTRMTFIDKVTVAYSIDENKACTYFGNNITVTFESMNIDGSDGDLPTMTADAINTDGDGTQLGHIFYTPKVTSEAWEIVKGKQAQDRTAIFVGNSDPATLKFEYVIQVGDNATHLEYVNSDSLARSVASSRSTKIYNAGTIVASNPTLPPPGFTGDWERGIGSSLSANNLLIIDVSAPIVTSVTSPHVDGTFGIGEVILIHVYFSKPIVVTGDPTIVLETGMIDRIVPFVQVLPSNDKIAEFGYIVQSKDTSPDLTYTETTALQLNSGTIKRKSTTPTTNAVLTLPSNGGTGSLSVNKNIVIDTSNPKVTSVTSASADGIYTAGDVVELIVNFDAPVAVTGVPLLLLSTGTVDLFPGEFIQEAPTVDSSKTIVFPQVDHGLTTEESTGLQFKVGEQILTVSSVAGDKVTMVEDYTGSIVNSTTIVSTSISVKTPGYRSATYVSGSGMTALKFAYTVQIGDTSLDLDYLSQTALVTNGGSIRRLSTTPFTPADLTLPVPGDTGSLGFTASIVINSDRPQVLSVSPLTRDGVYRSGEEIFLQVLFDIPVTVYGFASILLALHGTSSERYAVYERGSGSSALVFKYSCKPSDPTVPVFDYAGTTALRPAYGNVFGWVRRKSMSPLLPAVLALPASGLSSKGISINQACTSIVAITTSHEDGTIGVGEVVDIQVEFSVAVDVILAAAAPSLLLTTGGTANYVSGTASTVLLFRYVVGDSDLSVRLNYPDRFALQLNGAEIRDTVGAALAMTLLVPLDESGLLTESVIFIDTSSPVVQAVTTTSSHDIVSVGDRVDVAVRFSSPIVIEPVLSGVGTPVLLLDAGTGTSVSAPFVASDANIAYFSYTVRVGESTSQLGYASRTSLRCSGGGGMNKDSTQDAQYARARIFQDRLYVTWAEQAASNNKWQVRLKSVDITRGAVIWRSEDGDGALSGINFDSSADASSPFLVIALSKMYLIWQEVGQIRVAVYSSSTRTRSFVERMLTTTNGINMNAARSASSPSAIAHNAKLYIAWQEPATAGGATQIRIAVFNGNDLAPSWTFVDGNLPTIGVNKLASSSARSPKLCSCRASATTSSVYLFATWEEDEAISGTQQIRVAVKSGPDSLPAWRFVDGNGKSGLNFNAEMSGSSPSIACAGGGSVVVAWHEMATSGFAQIRVKVFNGNLSAPAWTPLDGSIGLNFDSSQQAQSVNIVTRDPTAVYMAWEEVNSATQMKQVRVAYLASPTSNAQWSFLDGGQQLSTVNDDASHSATEPKLIATSDSDRLYAVWQEAHANSHSQLRVSLRSGPVGEWQSLCSRCILRQSSQPSISANLLLPAKNAPGALDFSNTIRVDTTTPKVQRIFLVGEASNVTTVASVTQTIDIFNQASITQGQYQLQYGRSIATACINWNAAASGAVGSVEEVLKSISGLALDVSVTQDSSVFLDGTRYTVVFDFPSVGVQNLRLVASASENCAAFQCQSGALLPCNVQQLIRVNEGIAVDIHSGVVDVAVQFSAPVVVPTGVSSLALNVGVDRTAVYTIRSALQEFDVGVNSPGSLVKGAFRLAYGDFSTGSAVGAVATTDCIEVSPSNADAVQQFRFALENVPALKTIGIQSVSRVIRRNGFRYTVTFRNSGDLLDLISADSSSCTQASGRTQTIDIRADSTILSGEFKVTLGDTESDCMPWNIRAQGPTASLQSVLSNLYGDRIIPLAVEKDTSRFDYGARFYINFLMLNDASKPLGAYVCAAFMCDDGGGGTTACTGLEIVPNADFQVTRAISDTISFRYAAEAMDDAKILAYLDSTALTGTIVRGSASNTLAATLELPTPMSLAFAGSDSPLTIAAFDSIPSVLSASSASLDDTYTAGDILLILIKFSRAVAVEGQPVLELNSNGKGLYMSGSGTNELAFHYRIRAGEAAIRLNYASIFSLRTPSTPPSRIRCLQCSSSAIEAQLTLPPLDDPMSLASRHNLVVETVQPVIMAVSSSRPDSLADSNGYGVGDIIDIQVEFSHDVHVVGEAYLALSSGGSAAFTYAGYRQVIDVGVDSLYPIISGQFAVVYDGILSGCIDFDDADSAAETSLKSQLLTYEMIVEIGLVSVVRSRKKNGYRYVVLFDATNTLSAPLAIELAEPDVCLPLLPSSPVQAATRHSDTILTFQYVVEVGHSTTLLDTTGSAVVFVDENSKILRQAFAPIITANVDLPVTGSLASLGVKSSIVVDGIPARIIDIVSDTVPGTYGVAYPPIASPSTVFPGEIQFRLIFSRAVVVVGTPIVELATGSLQLNGEFLPNRFATFVSQPPSNEVIFLYRIQAGDYSANLAIVTINALAGATIYCLSSSSHVQADLVLPRTIISSGGAIEINSWTVPTTVELSSSHEDGTFGAGELIPIQVTFSKEVTLLSGLNFNQEWHARHPLAIEFNNNIFIMWTERETLVTATQSYLYLRVFSSATLEPVSLTSTVPVNRFPGSFIERASMTIWNDELYAAWDENGLIFCAVYQGISSGYPWELIPNAGANKNIAMAASDATLLVHNLKLMLVWVEKSLPSGSHDLVGQIRVAQRNDDRDAPLWIFQDGNDVHVGINKNPLMDARQPTAIVYRGTMYVSWAELNTNGAYEIVVAQRYVQNRDLSFWTYVSPLPSASPEYPFLSSYRPQLVVRRRGFEDISLVISWYRDTVTSNVTEIVTGQVFDLDWGAIIQGSVLQAYSVDESPNNSFPNAKDEQFVSCGNQIFSSWIETASATGGRPSALLKLASLDVNGDVSSDWSATGNLSDFNHNSKFDVIDSFLVCSSVSSTPQVGLLWTEYDGYSLKLRFRHEGTSQRIAGNSLTAFGEALTGMPRLKLETGTIPAGYAYSVDKSGLTSYVLTFTYIVEQGHTSADLDAFDQDSLVLNGALLHDAFGQTPDLTLFPRLNDPRSLSFNNDLVIDSSTPVVVSVSSSTLSGIYGVGELFRIGISFSAPVIVIKGDESNTPRMYLLSDQLHVLDKKQNAALYASGSGTNVLMFEYTSTEQDYCDRLDYFDSQSLVLNGNDWSVRRKATFPITAADLTLPLPGSAHSLAGSRAISIKPDQPRILSLTTPAADGTYYTGDQILVDVAFSLPVVVFGAPVLRLATGTTAGSRAKFSGGNGTSTLQFLYEVQSGDIASSLDVVDDRANGSEVDYAMSLRLVGGSQIKRLSTYPTTSAIIVVPAPGLPGSLSFLKTLVIDTIQPSIIDVRSTSMNGTYDVGQPIDIQVEFSRKVLVIGTPRIVLNVAGYFKRTAIYTHGSETNTLLFRYYPVEGDNTLSKPLDYSDTYSFIFGPLFADGGALTEPARILGLSSKPITAANTILPEPGPALRADAVRSLVANNHRIYVRTDGFRVQRVQADVPSGVYSPGQRILLVVTFTDMVVVQGAPIIKLNVDGSADRFASFINGSGTAQLVFQYIVQAGDNCETLEAASATAMELNGGAITDTNAINVPLHLAEPKQPGSLSFETTISISSVPPSVKQVICLNSSGEYGVGDELYITISFTRAVVVVADDSHATPSLILQLLNGQRVASYTSGSGTSSLVFTILLVAGDSSSNLEYVNQNALSGTILADATAPSLLADLQLPVPGETGSLSMSSVVSVVSTPPEVVAVSVTDRNGTYGIGNDIIIHVRFSFRVVIAPSTLPPCTLKIAASASGVRTATYIGGSSTKTLSFLYTVQPGDQSPRFDYVCPNSLSCSLKQATKLPEVTALTLLPPPGSTGSLGLSSRIRLDSTAPRVTLVTSSMLNGVYGAGQVVSIEVVFSEAVVVISSVPQLRLAVSSPRATSPRVASYTRGSGTTTLHFVYTVQEGDMALPLEYADIDALSVYTPEGAIAAAEAGQISYRVATLRLPVPRSTGSLSNTKDIHIDTSEPPRVISVESVNPDGVYTAGDKITIVLRFTQPVAVTGAPQLILNTGNPSSTDDDKMAVYASGSGSTQLLFEYVVQVGDHVDRLDYRPCPFADRIAPTVRKWSKHVICTESANALRLGQGGSIKRSATVPTTDAVLDLPDVSAWAKVRVETSQQGVTYVDQVEPSTGTATSSASDQEDQSENEFGVAEKRSSRLLFSNGIPDHSSMLKDSNQLQQQQYFIELQRFPWRQSNPLIYKSSFGSFLGIFLNGIPFKPLSVKEEIKGTDDCGGAIDSLNRYFYYSLPSCFLRSIGEPQEPADVGVFEMPAPRPASVLVGYAFDGFPVYGIYDEDGQIPTLDECHGRIRKDGEYCYHLVLPRDAVDSPFMPCLRGIDALNINALSVFRYPADISAVDGLSLQELTQFDGFVVDENPYTLPTESIWLNPSGVSVVHTASSVIVRSNGVPVDGTFGPFPSASNRFAVQVQNYVFQFPRHPTVSSSPTTLPLDTPIGVMLNGVPFYSHRSSIYGDVMQTSSSAYRLMDKCHGLVDQGGDYRYYASPDCLIDQVGDEAPLSPSPLIGYAFDGFPIYGLYTEDGVLPTDLDECNGRVGEDGTYRYHTSLTAPYLIGCFRGAPLSGLVVSTENIFRSLSYNHAIRINTDIPYIAQLYTNKRPGTFVAGETIDVVVGWSAPVMVETMGGNIPTVQIENSTNVAVFDSGRSSPTESVFIFTVTTDSGEFSHVSRSQIQLNGATIRRLSAAPTLDADLNLVNAEHNSRFSSKYQLVKELQVSLRGLYHPQAGDLNVRLFHGLQSSWIFGHCCATTDTFGIPDIALRVNSAQIRAEPTNPISGVGWDYTFRDFKATNLALDGKATATQSSTSARCFASNAIDGKVHGRVSTQTVARTSSRSDRVGWWQLRLVDPSEIGTIRVWMAQPERLPAHAVRLRVDSSDGLSTVTGSFTLQFTTPDGTIVETSEINYNAVATVKDENSRVSTVGIGLGESIEAKLLALKDMPRVFVTRSPADAALSATGAFTWDITFMDNPRSPSIEVLAIGSNNICDGEGIAETVHLYPGDNRDHFEYFESDDRPDMGTPGKVPMIPFWIMLFEPTAVLDVDSFEDAYARAIWTFCINEKFANQSVVAVYPPVGTVAQYVRIVAEHANAYLTIAEIEVFKERSHQLSDYRSGSPVSTVFYPGAEPWSPEEPLKSVFGDSESGGSWTLSIADTTRELTFPTSSVHGVGAISDWVLSITSYGGDITTYYMDVKAHVETLPRHGRLFVALNGTERDHADSDGNGVLDTTEADAFLERYALNYGSLPDGTRSRTLISFMSGYDAYGGIEILRDPSERQKLMPSLCDRECYESRGVDPFVYPGATGDVGLKLMVVRGDRIVRYVPNPDFRGTDAFTYSIWFGNERSAVRGTVWLSVDDCQDRECVMANSFLHREG